MVFEKRTKLIPLSNLGKRDRHKLYGGEEPCVDYFKAEDSDF